MLLFVCFNYNMNIFTGNREQRSRNAEQTKLEFFTTDTLTEICRQLIMKFFPLSSLDLAQWESDPEYFGRSTHENSL